MILFILSVALLNFGLGYALAVALADAPLLPPGFFGRLKSSLRADADFDAEWEEADTTPASLADLPADWHSQLVAEGFSPATMLDGLLLKLWLEVGFQREELLTAEVRGRQALVKMEVAALGQLLLDVRSELGGWLTLLAEVKQILQRRLEVLGSEHDAGVQLDLMLDQQQRNLRAVLHQVAELTFDFEPELNARKLLDGLGRAIDAVHQSRDVVQHLLAQKLRGEAAPRELGQPLYTDAATGQISRMGLEGLLEMWWHDDPQRLRLASCALLKIDRFAQLNSRLGYRAGDRLLTAIASLLAASIRTDRGFDRLARLSGDTFLLFFGDTGPGNAAVAAERIRQKFEAVTLDYEGNELDVSLSVGVAPVQREDDVDDLLARAQAALRNAERNGKNRTSVDHGEGPAPLYESLRHPVRAQRVPIAAA